MFCFPFSQSRSLLCFVKLAHPPSGPAVPLDSSLRGSTPDSLSMRVTLAVTACMLSVVSSSSSPANTLPDIENEGFIKDCVRMHNKFRSEVTPKASDMLYMVRKTWVLVAEVSQKQRMWIDFGGESLLILTSALAVMKVCFKFTTCDQNEPSFALPTQFLL